MKFMKPKNQSIFRAFSLVELLVTIAVIAIIAAIAIPNIGNITQSADITKTRRNAQNLAFVYNAAISAGMPTNAASDLPGAIELITNGINTTNGNIVQFFSVDGLTPRESSNAASFLLFVGGTIRINP